MFRVHKWSWWDSNPRPNSETICFLHAYSSLLFSWRSKTWTTNYALILLFSLPQWGLRKLFPIVLHRWFLRFGKTSLERCLAALPCNAIKPVTYCTSVRQRERNYFRQLILWSLCLRSKPTRLRVLTYHFICCQIQSPPVWYIIKWVGYIKLITNLTASVMQPLLSLF